VASPLLDEQEIFETLRWKAFSAERSINIISATRIGTPFSQGLHWNLRNPSRRPLHSLTPLDLPGFKVLKVKAYDITR